MAKRIKVAVVFGGRSSEHSVSCVSAGSILRHLDKERFEVVPVGITRGGSWVLGPSDPSALAIADRALPEVDPAGADLVLPADPARAGQLLSVEDGEAAAALDTVDVVFPILHGPFGEDGTIQGLLELAGVPYVGPGVLASAAGMDKEFTKKLLAAEGLPIGRQVVLRPGTATLTEEQKADLGLPLFVKPARGGSSIGISRVTDPARLDEAIALARRHDPKVIVEAGIVGREVECGVLEFPDGTVRASVLAEIKLPGEMTAPAGDGGDGAGADPAAGPGDAFYDFDTKYLDNTTELEVPASLDAGTTAEIQRIAVAAFRALDCQGLARVDFFATADGPVINEVNTMPGFTQISMYPRMWAESGVDYPTLLTTLVETALARGTGLR